MLSNFCLKGSINPIHFFKIINYRRKFAKNNPDYFYPDGLTIFVGCQGSGKTLSAVSYCRNLLKMYPKCIFVTNIDVFDFPIDNNRVFLFKNALDLQKYNNGQAGVLFLIDEIQLYFNSLESKNIDPEVMVQISQQRKQRKHIVATSQIFGRMAKPLREQFSNVIICRNYLNAFQVNSYVDRDSLDHDVSTDTNLVVKVKRKYIWFHKLSDYNSYDTYKLIDNNFKTKGGVDIYGNTQ